MASIEGSIKQAADLAIQAHAAARGVGRGQRRPTSTASRRRWRDAGHDAAAHLAELAHAETGYGRVDHKTFKNIFCTRRVPATDPPRPDGRRGRELTRSAASPRSPSRSASSRASSPSRTRPRRRSSTAIACVRARNAVVNAAAPARRDDASPRRRAMLDEAADRGRRAAEPDHVHDRGVDRGHPGADGATTAPTWCWPPARGRWCSRRTPPASRPTPSAPATRRPTCTARAPTWARPPPASWPRRRFDNGTACASEQAVIADASIADRLQRGVQRRAAAYFCTAARAGRSCSKLLFPSGPGTTFNVEIVGQYATRIAEMAGLSRAGRHARAGGAARPASAASTRSRTSCSAPC